VAQVKSFHLYQRLVRVLIDGEDEAESIDYEDPLSFRSLGSNLEPSAEEKRRAEIDRIFRALLQREELRIIDMERDGNCLFRSFAYFLFDDPELHPRVRQECYDYMESEIEYFRQFIDGSPSDYVRRQRQEKVWGDQVEIEAMRERYDVNVLVFDMFIKTNQKEKEKEKEKEKGKEKEKDTEKKKQVGEETPAEEEYTIDVKGAALVSGLPTVRLSFHGRNHFNAVLKGTAKHEVLRHSSVIPTTQGIILRAKRKTESE